MVPSVLRSVPVPSAAKQTHMTTLPPPCCTAGMVARPGIKILAPMEVTNGLSDVCPEGMFSVHGGAGIALPKIIIPQLEAISSWSGLTYFTP